MRISSVVLLSLSLFGAAHLRAGENREVKIDIDKERVERAELRLALDEELPLATVEHREVLLGLRKRLEEDKEGKFDHLVEIRRLHKHHPELIERLIHRIHEHRERERERKEKK